MASSNYIIKSSRKRLTQILAKKESLTKDDFHNQNFFMRAMHEGVDGLLLPIVERSESLDMNADVRESYRFRMHDKQVNHLRTRHVCGQVLSALQAAGIAVICMRGIAVSERLYGDEAYLRPQSDIDLLFQPDRMVDAKQVLWDLGFRPDFVYQDNFVRGDMALDLHVEPLGIERIQAWQFLTPLRAPDFFESSISCELAGEKALHIAAKVELPYLCFHALKHSFERLIWLYDIALLAQKVEADQEWGEVLAGIKQYQLERPCFYALSYVKAYLNAPVPAEMLSEIQPKMNLIERNLFARFMDHEIIPYLAERLFARMMPDFSHRVSFWRETIYPSYDVRKQIAEGGCVKCNFIRKRLKQVAKAAWLLCKEGVSLLMIRKV